MNFTYDLSRIKNKEQLLRFLEIEEQNFDQIIQFKPSNPTEGTAPETLNVLEFVPFFQHSIPKKNAKRGVRVVWEAIDPFSHIYKALSRRLNLFFSKTLDSFPHPNAFGYITGRNIRENAGQHLGRRYLLKVDIENFFPSIKKTRVVSLFTSLGVNLNVAAMLGDFLTIDDALPLGLSPSPSIANAICLEMDNDLATLAQSFGATYSRYADDITFSCDNSLPRTEEVFTLIQKHGFEIAHSKTRHSTIGQAHFVTGLSVSDPKAPHIPKASKRKLRQEIFYAQRFGLYEHFSHLGITSTIEQQWAVNRLDGMVKYISFHEPQLSKKLHTSWERILEESNSRPSFSPKNSHRKAFYLYFDESEIVWNDKKYLALAVSATQHQEQLDSATNDVLENFLANPWLDGKRESIEKNGMHFTDATEDLKLKYVETMQSLLFQGYVAFSKYTDSVDYEQTYIKILKTIIKRRLMAAESQFAFLCFEENGKVSQKRIKDTIKDAFNELKNHNNRRPCGYDVRFVNKSTLGVSIPDFLLGVLGKYLKSVHHVEGAPHSREHLMFERLRDKYRLILNVDSAVEYSRRNPIRPW